MAHTGPPTAQAAPGPRTPLQNERQEQKRDLASWWKNFKRSDKKPQEAPVPQGIFGVPLQHSIRYANVAISLINDQGHSYIYGYVPIVVAKCGVFLKEKATETEGIFRLAGNERRIKELKVAFDSPDRFGKGLDWTGYTVHDAANILRRYFNQLPEPIIPLDFYNRFRDPLRNHQAQAVGQIEAQSPSVGDFDPNATISIYQKLITELPPLNRQLLLYILDLLAVFASKSDMNKMTTPNLAAIFQPGILSHPSHDMAPPEYRLSQDVLIFLIENQDSFLIGMQGTEADPQTVRDVSSGTPPKSPGSPSTPGRSKTIIGRSSSNASTRAESVKKVADLRRNVSVSSKQSKRSENGPTPVPAGMSPSGSVHRSNTVPSRRDGSNAHSPRITREKVSEEVTPETVSPAIVVDPAKPRQESLQSTPVAATAPQFPVSQAARSPSPGAFSTAIDNEDSSEYQTPRKDIAAVTTPATARTEQSAQTPSTSPGRFLDIFKPSPTSGDEGRKPNKLQKRQRIPGGNLSSAQSSTHSLGTDEHANIAPQAAAAAAAAVVAASNIQDEGSSVPATQPTESINAQTTRSEGMTEPTTSPNTSAALAEPARNLSADHGLRPTISPSPSYRSATESDAEMVGDDMPRDSASPPSKEKRRHRWRFSRSQNKLETSPPPVNPLGTLTAREQTTSRSTVGSNGGRKSFQEPTPLVSSGTDPVTGSFAQGQTFSSSSTDPAVFSDSEREKRSGPMSWIRGKMSGSKDKEVEKGARTPSRGRELPGSRSELQPPTFDSVPGRGKSIEAQRNNLDAPAPVTSSPPAAETTTTTSAPRGTAAESLPTANGEGAGQRVGESATKEAATTE